jgi:23S rRNA (pseudouridine1915-N3)-methyltransferase
VIITIIVIGKTKENALASLQRSYLERLRNYTRVGLSVLRGINPSTGSRALPVEGERILEQLQRSDFVVALDSRGREYTSKGFSSFLHRHLVGGTKRMVFVAGGPYGLDASVVDRADLVLSFSRFTFTHEMIRVLLLEQLYRAWTLLRGEKYHK